MLVMWLVLRPLDLFPRYFNFWAPVVVYLIADGVVSTVRWCALRKSGTAKLMAAVAALVMAGAITYSAATSIKHTLSSRSDGWRPLLHPMMRGWRSVGVGGDAVMFRYYLGEPFETLQSVHEVNAAL